MNCRFSVGPEWKEQAEWENSSKPNPGFRSTVEPANPLKKYGYILYHFPLVFDLSVPSYTYICPSYLVPFAHTFFSWPPSLVCKRRTGFFSINETEFAKVQTILDYFKAFFVNESIRAFVLSIIENRFHVSKMLRFLSMDAIHRGGAVIGSVFNIEHEQYCGYKRGNNADIGIRRDPFGPRCDKIASVLCCGHSIREFCRGISISRQLTLTRIDAGDPLRI